jgi:hypothetical protein
MEATYTRYRARGVVAIAQGPGIDRVGEAFPPNPSEDLIYRGGRTIAQLSCKTFYVGRAWSGGLQASARQDLDAALSYAMSDPALNEIVGQYFGGSTIASSVLPSMVLDAPLKATFDKNDVHALAERVFMTGVLSGIDLDNCVINFVLPPGALLSSDDSSDGGEARARTAPVVPQEEEDSKHGLGGYHGSVHVEHPGSTVTLYYAVSVWSDGANGIPIPGWQPWENVCATLYHELNEARTDPDVEDAIRTNNIGWSGWNSASGQEIGDYPVYEAGRNLSLVFRKVAIAGAPAPVPIQLLWSNRIHGPEAPGQTQAALAPGVISSPAMISIDSIAPLAPRSSVAFGTSTTLAAPGNLTDFVKPESAGRWSGRLSGYFDSAVSATQNYLKGLPSQFFNPAKGSPASSATELPIRWPGFPRLLENSNLTPEEQLRQAELIAGNFLGRYQHQDEYLEWFVTRDKATQKIVRVDFTCEGPEYWEAIAEWEPDVLLKLYQQHVDRAVQSGDLIDNGQYNSLNIWNARQGAMHLIQPNNTLNAEIRIAGDATILRRNPDGSLKTDAQDLINCAKYGVAGRASDPHIGDLVNGLARAGYLISIRDPVGLYMSRPRLNGCTTPDGNPISQNWFKIARGTENYILRGIFQAPPGSAYTVGDLAIGGINVAYGGQIAKLIDMGLTGIAYNKGSVKDPAFACVASASGTAVNNAVTRALGRVL